MQRFYVYSIEGDGSFLAWRLKQEGYEVVWKCEDAFMRQNLKGIIEHTLAQPRLSDIIVFDGVGSGSYANELRDSGHAVIGSSELADQIELDRSFASDLCRQLEIKQPRSARFDSISDGIEFVTRNSGRWVFKPSNNADCSFTYVARDEIDMVSMLMHFQSRLGESCDYILQEFIDGVAVSTEGWFDGEDWIEGAWNQTIERKELMSGNVGPKTGCAWNVVWACERVPRLGEQFNMKLTEHLARDGYVGPWDMNVIVSAAGEAYFLEATPRFGYDAIQAYAALSNFGLGEMLLRLAEQDTELWSINTDEVACALRIAIPPYPYGSAEHPAAGDIPIRFRHEDTNHLWLAGVQQQRRGGLTSAPTDGTIGAIVSTSKMANAHDAYQEAKEIAQRLSVPNLIWRDDVGAGVEDDWAQLPFDSPTAASNLATSSITPIGQSSTDS